MSGANPIAAATASAASAGSERWARLAAEAARPVLALGGIVAFATESSYGLGVDPRSAAGVEAIYRLKVREKSKPLPIIASDVAQLVALGVDPASGALAWARSRWPAALSVVLPLVPSGERSLPAAAGGSSIAARIPDRPSLRELLAALGFAITATSANPSGSTAYCDPGELARWLEASGERYCLIDDGRSPGGGPSTLVEIVNGSARVLREGRFDVH